MRTFRPLLVILADEGFGVHRDDRDLAPAVGVVAVGWEGEDGCLIPNLSRYGWIRLDLILAGLIQLGDMQVAHTYSDLIRVGRGVVVESIRKSNRAAWTTQHSLAELNALGEGLGDTIYSGD